MKEIGIQRGKQFEIKILLVIKVTVGTFSPI